jgi:AcrR family transcriptional regulator
LFVAEGYQNVSIRKIAERIEYSPAAIYSYFPSKDDIFFALAEEGFRLLGGPLDPSSERLQPLDSLDRIRVLFQNLYDFSRNHPQYFTLMFVDRSVPRIIQEYERFRFVGSSARSRAPLSRMFSAVSMRRLFPRRWIRWSPCIS